MMAGGETVRGSLPPRTAPVRFAAFTLDLDGCSLSRAGGVTFPSRTANSCYCASSFGIPGGF